MLTVFVPAYYPKVLATDSITADADDMRCGEKLSKG
jgi:hypothetical protein